MVHPNVPYRFISRLFFPAVGLILLFVGTANLWRARELQKALENQLKELQQMAKEHLSESEARLGSLTPSPPKSAPPVSNEAVRKEENKEFDGYRKVAPGEVVSEGMHIKMNLDTGETFVREHKLEKGTSAVVPVGQVVDEKKDRVDIEAVKRLQRHLKPVPKLQEAASKRRPRIDHFLEKLRIDSVSLKADLDTLDGETLGNDACVGLWSSVNLDNLLVLLGSKDAGVRGQVGTIMFNSLHNLEESAKLAVKHIPLLCNCIKRETDDFALYKLISTVHTIFELVQNETVPILAAQAIWTDFGKCKRPLAFQKNTEMLTAIYPLVKDAKQSSELVETLASILEMMPKTSAQQLMAKLCPQVTEPKLLAYCRQ